MALRILALLIWAAVAASLAFWGLRWLAQPTAVPATASAVSLDNAGKGDPHKLLTGPAKASGPSQDSSQSAMLAGRIKLLGLFAAREGEQGGVALITVDGNPPRAIRLGAVVDGQYVLRSLTQRGAEIGPAEGPTVLTLDMPLLPPPLTGVLPPVSGFTTTPPPGATAILPPTQAPQQQQPPQFNSNGQPVMQAPSNGVPGAYQPPLTGEGIGMRGNPGGMRPSQTN